MHFGKQLKFLAREGWKNQYINFALLKKKLKEITKEARSTGRIQRVEVGRRSVDVARSSLDIGRRSMEQARTSGEGPRKEQGEEKKRKVTLEQTSSIAMGLRPSIDIGHYDGEEESGKAEDSADEWDIVSMGRSSESGDDGEQSEEVVKFEDVVELTYEWEQDWLDLLYSEKEKVSDFFVLVFMNCSEMMTKLFQYYQLEELELFQCFQMLDQNIHTKCAITFSIKKMKKQLKCKQMQFHL